MEETRHGRAKRRCRPSDAADGIIAAQRKCEFCATLGTEQCTSCVVGSTLEVIKDSINGFEHCQLDEGITRIVQAIQKGEVEDEKAFKDAADVIKEMQKVAKNVRSLQVKTKRVVRNVKSYGEYLIEAADDYLKDRDLEALMTEVCDMGNVKESLKDAIDKHADVVGDVESIMWRSKVIAEDCSEATEISLKMIKDHLGSSTGKESIVAAAGFFFRFPDLDGAIASSAAVLIPFIWYNFLSKHVDIKKEIGKRFASIANQMKQVKVHLANLSEALGNIEKRLNDAIRAEKRAKTDKEIDKEKMVKRMKIKAAELVDACDEYFRKVKQGLEPLTSTRSTPSSSTGGN